jgi:hypothetical protein
LTQSNTTLAASNVNLKQAAKRERELTEVESLEHGAALLRLGCRLGQGYGIARPMPPKNLPEWMQTWKNDKQWHELKSRFAQGEGIDIQAAVSSHCRWIAKLIEPLKHDLTAPQI